MADDIVNWLSDGKTDKEKPFQTSMLPVYLGLAGLLLVAVGFFIFNFKNNQSDVQVEVISTDEPTEKIVVDVQGAVENPGVYELDFGARLQDLLTKAGGLSAGADRDWVSTNLNLALKLTDGQKVFIPAKTEESIQNRQLSINTSQNKTTSVLGAESEKININNASLAQLDSLPGIGPARGQAIIDNRPYGSTDDLLAKKVVGSSVFEKIKELISVY